MNLQEQFDAAVQKAAGQQARIASAIERQRQHIAAQIADEMEGSGAAPGQQARWLEIADDRIDAVRSLLAGELPAGSEGQTVKSIQRADGTDVSVDEALAAILSSEWYGEVCEKRNTELRRRLGQRIAERDRRAFAARGRW